MGRKPMWLPDGCVGRRLKEWEFIELKVGSVNLRLRA